MTKDMAMILGGRLIPKPSTFTNITTPIESDNVTLEGTLYTDFMTNRRTWEVGWKLLTEEGMAIINQLYMEQYRLGIYHFLQFNAYSIYTPVKMNISKQDIKYNGGFIENFKIIIQEQYAIS